MLINQPTKIQTDRIDAGSGERLSAQVVVVNATQYDAENYGGVVCIRTTLNGWQWDTSHALDRSLVIGLRDSLTDVINALEDPVNE